MQIKTFLTVALSSASSTLSVTFHDGVQVPHARAAVEERYYDPNQPAGTSLFPSFLAEEPDLPATRARTTEHQEPSRTRAARIQPPTKEDPSIDRLKARTAKLYFGLKNREQREEAFVELNKMRQEDGLQPLSVKEFATASKRKSMMHKFRIAIWKLEQEKSIDPKMIPLFTRVKERHPELYKTIKYRVNYRKRMDQLLSLQRPLTPEETTEFENISKEYTKIRKYHRQKFH